MIWIFGLRHRNLNISLSLLSKTKQPKHEKVDHPPTQNLNIINDNLLQQTTSHDKAF